jgi:hypothetical protein
MAGKLDVLQRKYIDEERIFSYFNMGMDMM